MLLMQTPVLQTIWTMYWAIPMKQATLISTISTNQ